MSRPTPGFQRSAKDPAQAYDLSGRCKALEILGSQKPLNDRTLEPRAAVPSGTFRKPNKGLLLGSRQTPVCPKQRPQRATQHSVAIAAQV